MSQVTLEDRIDVQRLVKVRSLSLKGIKLKNSTMTSAFSSCLKGIPQLRALDISGNRIDADERVRWLLA